MRVSYLLALILSLVACGQKKMFEHIEASRSGIDFINAIADNDTLNILDVENIYNGAGIGVGDFNGDGLQDIFFAGNTTACKLYINSGDFKFKDVTQQAGATGEGKWIRGVSVVDINNDGRLDIYLSATILREREKRKNLLYINKGNKDGVPVFENMAGEYGLDDDSHSTMAAFFDYDRDGDLDMYLLVNEILKEKYPNTFRPEIKDGSHPSTDRLFRNDFNDSLGHPIFVNVSRLAGITYEGYGHGVNITDLNQDGWPDILVTNDFLSNNILYINQHDGSFKNEIKSYFKHMAENAMGLDVVDINNDGLEDVIELDMNPEDNFRKKMMLNPLNYSRYINNDQFDYQYQYVRNMMHLNRGNRVTEDSSNTQPVFSEIGFLAGIAETDWSWAPVVTDFDQDGYRDIIITNGFPKDVTDHDFIAYRQKSSMLTSKRELLDMLPQVKIANYAFKNQGDLTFSNKTIEWGLDIPTFSNAAAYADFDNDGDMDLVVSNINDKPDLYRNRIEKQKTQSNYLNIRLKGVKSNPAALGANISIWYGNIIQRYRYSPYRGYLSTYQQIAHFGLGSVASVDSVRVEWPDGTCQTTTNVKTNQELLITQSNFNLKPALSDNNRVQLFNEVTRRKGLVYKHREFDFVDFNIQRLLPHKLSEYGPAIAAGDLNGDGLDDLVCGGSLGYMAQLFFQQPDGTFLVENLFGNTDSLPSKTSEDQGLLLFDADGDKDLDLYIASGGYESKPGSSDYQDRLYINQGDGKFVPETQALPQVFVSKSCVKAADVDRDGDLDLFVGGRVEPGKYPSSVQSFLFRNDSKNGLIRFTDITAQIAPDLMKAGMICDAIFTDINNDDWPDLVLAGEWMPIVILQNEKGKFRSGPGSESLKHAMGWWNSLAAGDVDNDGDIDYIAGNLGLNTYYRATPEHPVFITAGDFDGNGRFDAIPSLFLPVSAKEKMKKEFPAQLRDDMIEGIPVMRKRFPDYSTYASSTMEALFTTQQRKGSFRLQANHMSSSLIRNDGQGKFSLHALPSEAQFSMLNGMVLEDFNGDGNLDLLLNGNDFGTEVPFGRYDALNGLVLLGLGDGNFKTLSIAESGIYIPGNGKGASMLRNQTGELMVAATENRGPLRIFEARMKLRTYVAEPEDASVVIFRKNGKTQRREFNYGNSFLSQSTRVIVIPESADRIEIRKFSGKTRTIRY